MAMCYFLLVGGGYRSPMVPPAFPSFLSSQLYYNRRFPASHASIVRTTHQNNNTALAGLIVNRGITPYYYNSRRGAKTPIRKKNNIPEIWQQHKWTSMKIWLPRPWRFNFCMRPSLSRHPLGSYKTTVNRTLSALVLDGGGEELQSF